MALRSDEDFEAAARQLRSESGVNDYFCPDLIFILDELKKANKITGYRRVPDSDIDDLAFYDSTENMVVMRETVYSTLDHPFRASKIERRAARFTIAHELAHFARRHEGRHFRGVINERARAIPSKVGAHETEANRFAAAFLMPAHLAPPGLSAEDLSDLFNVNLRPAQIRKDALERMRRRAMGVKRPLTPKTKEFFRDARRKGYKIDRLDEDDLT